MRQQKRWAHVSLTKVSETQAVALQTNCWTVAQQDRAVLTTGCGFESHRSTQVETDPVSEVQKVRKESRMLVLGRDPGQEVLIQLPDGQEITITLIDDKGRRMRIGIEAPKHFNIYRKELICASQEQEEKTA